MGKLKFTRFGFRRKNMLSTVNTFSESFSQYRSRIQRSKNALSYASSTSLEELVFNFQKIKLAKGNRDFLKSLLSITNSSVWVSRSAFSVLRSYFDVRQLENHNLQNAKSQEILAGIANKSSVDASNDLIFKTIYTELTRPFTQRL